jgi:hypothetical protein
MVRQIVDDARARNYRFAALLLGIVESVPFQMRIKPAAAPSAAAAVEEKS